VKKWLPIYGAYFLGVICTIGLGYWCWHKYGDTDETVTNVTVVTGDSGAMNGHHPSTHARRYQ